MGMGASGRNARNGRNARMEYVAKYTYGASRFVPLALLVSPGYMKEVEYIELLTKKKLLVLFPEAHVQNVNIASALIAFHAA